MTKIEREIVVGLSIGLFSGILSFLVFYFIPLEYRKDFLLVVSTIIPSLYLGFAIQEGTRSKIYTQLIAAMFFIGLALLAAWKWPIIFAVGIILHGFWDMFHHSSHASLKVQRWYPPFCAVYDWTFGISLLFLLSGE